MSRDSRGQFSITVTDLPLADEKDAKLMSTAGLEVTDEAFEEAQVEEAPVEENGISTA